MRRLAIVLALLPIVSPAFTDALWQDIPRTYTSILGQEFCDEVVLRSRWAGDSNYNFTTTIYGNSYTNIFGSTPVPFTRIGAESLSRQLEAVLPLYVHPYYTTDPDYDLEPFFAKTNRFPLATKSDMFQKCGVGLVTRGSGATMVDGTQASNFLGEITGDAHWLKRMNMRTGIIVGEFNRNGQTYNRGHTEFSSGASLPWPDFPKPVWIVHHVGHNTAINYTLKYTGTNAAALAYIWQTNTPVDVSADLLAHPSAYDEPITALTQQAAHAWISMSGEWKLTGTPANSKDVVSLVYTSRPTVYEGSKIWDTTLYREPLHEIYQLATNLFLTQWTQYTWTNFNVSSNSTSTNIWWDSVDPDSYLADWSYYGGIEGAQECPVPDFTEWWPPIWHHPDEFPLKQDRISAEIPTNNLINTNGIPPFFQVSTVITGSFVQHAELTFDQALIDYYGTNYWMADIYNSRRPIVNRTEVQWADGALRIENLYAGTPHCAHVYIQTSGNDVDYGWTSSLKRLGRYPATGFTTNATIVTDKISFSNLDRFYLDGYTTFQTSGPDCEVKHLPLDVWWVPFIEVGEEPVVSGGVYHNIQQRTYALTNSGLEKLPYLYDFVRDWWVEIDGTNYHFMLWNGQYNGSSPWVSATSTNAEYTVVSMAALTNGTPPAQWPEPPKVPAKINSHGYLPAFGQETNVEEAVNFDEEIVTNTPYWSDSYYIVDILIYPATSVVTRATIDDVFPSGWRIVGGPSYYATNSLAPGSWLGLAADYGFDPLATLITDAAEEDIFYQSSQLEGRAGEDESESIDAVKTDSVGIQDVKVMIEWAR